MICEKCGANISKGAKKCSTCGATLPSTSASTGFADILSFKDHTPENGAASAPRTGFTGDFGSRAPSKETQELINLTSFNVVISMAAAGLALIVLILSIVFGAVTLSKLGNLQKEMKNIDEDILSIKGDNEVEPGNDDDTIVEEPDNEKQRNDEENNGSSEEDKNDLKDDERKEPEEGEEKESEADTRKKDLQKKSATLQISDDLFDVVNENGEKEYVLNQTNSSELIMMTLDGKDFTNFKINEDIVIDEDETEKILTIEDKLTIECNNDEHTALNLLVDKNENYFTLSFEIEFTNEQWEKIEENLAEDE